jgi:ferric-dicitrate binding protein FerR (iron transport regulator)
MDREKLHKKWLADELTPTELIQIKSEVDFNLSEKIVTTAAKFKANTEYDVPDYQSLHTKITRSKKAPVRYLRYVPPMAAVLIIALGIFSLWNLDNDSTFETAMNDTKLLTLPDQSVVTLNAESTLTYNEANWEKDRTLELIGEAYFEVEKGSTFTVNTKDGTIQVLGTKFNVNTRKDYFKVSCFEGRVQVTTPLLVEQLIKNDQVTIIRGIAQKNTSSFESPTWLQQHSTFKNVPLAIVYSELERQYAIQITKTDADLDRIFSGSFTHQNLKEALKSVTAPMQLKYQFLSSKQVEIYE